MIERPHVAADATAAPVAATNASGTIRIAVPPAAAGAGRALRSAQYVSPGTTRAALFIDGATAPAGQTNACTSGACTISWSAALAVPAAHIFAVEVDDGTNVLAEGTKSYAIVAGNNGTLATETLEGVAAAGTLSGETCPATTCTGTLTVSDAAADPITNTTSPPAPAYDNGPLAFASTAGATGTTSPASLTQPAASGASAYTLACRASTGSFQTTLTPASGSGAITAAELVARSLVYPAAIGYSTKTYYCTAGAAISNGLYVATNASANGIRVYPAKATGAAAPAATVTSASLNSPQGVALDASGRIYVANQAIGANSIAVFAANPSGTMNETPVAVIAGAATGLNNPQGVALDASGRVYVANNAGNAITIYAASPVGTLNEAPLATISGSNTTLANPVALTVDASGRIYVANAASNDILVFPAYPAGGNETPVAAIAGGSTAISNPNAVALDASGRVYVANYTPSTVTVYANPSGLVTSAPLATIGGGSTGVSSPTGVVLDSSGRIYIANDGASTVTVYAANPSGAVTSAPVASITGVSAIWGLAIR